jgi:hypothetical protein
VPENFVQYIRNGRKLDLVLNYNAHSCNVAGWVEFVRYVAQHFGSHASMLQITEEPNLTHVPVIDGSFPNVREALVEGVVAAKEEAALHEGHDQLQIGFSAVPSFDPQDDFWSSIGHLGWSRFAESLDYVGLDFYPDVFMRVSPTGLLGDLRHSI